MNYKIGEFYLIKKFNERLNLNKYIGEITNINGNKTYSLKIYIFPESTKTGRKDYMSINEVYSTERKISYQFNGQNETKIELISFERFLNLKQNNQKVGKDIFFYRQSYSFETNKFIPEKLPLTCYCKKIFKPDLPFKQCICGNYFHVSCFIKSSSNECWSNNCNYNCNNFLDTSQRIQKLMNKSDENDNTNIKKINSPKKNNKTKSLFNYKYNNELLNRKTNRKKEENPKYNYNNNNLSLSKRETSITSIKSRSDKKEVNLDIFKNEKSILILKKSNSSQEQINREKGQSIIYKVLFEGYNLMENNRSFKRQYELSDLVNKITKVNIKNYSEQIEEYLFSLYKSNPSSYKNYLQEFNKMKKDSQDILLKIILGHFTPRQISLFKGDDFLSEEKKQEKEQKKKSEIEKMKIKEEENKFQFSMSKGNLLAGKEIIIENNNENENINLNLIRINSTDKIQEKREQYPNLKNQDIKLLIDLETPSIKNIKKRLENMLKENLDINTLNYFMEKRKNIITKKAKNMLIQELKKNNIYNSKDLAGKENIQNNPELNEKMNEYMNKISFNNLNGKLTF